jgi:hypothetical protein
LLDENRLKGVTVTHSALDDAALVSTRLVITDPSELADALSSKPPTGAAVELLSWYDVPKGADQRCCFCSNHTAHRLGYLCKFGTEDAKYLVGNVCGREILGDEFIIATRSFKGDIQRQKVIQRLQSFGARAEEFIGWSDSVLFSDDLRQLAALAAQFSSLAGDAFIRLKSLSKAGGMLTQNIQVRDYAAEQSRNEDDKRGPIFKYEEQAIGRLVGSALFDIDSLKDDVYQLKKSVKEAAATAQAITANKGENTTTLKRISKRVSDSHVAARRAIDALSTAQRFFEADNLNNVIRWYSGSSNFTFRVEGGGLSITKGSNEPTLLQAPKPVQWPLIPSLTEIG